MPESVFIAGDWGTSNLTLYLFGRRPENEYSIIDTRTGPGVNAIQGQFEEAFFELVADWTHGQENLPAIISGMAGSNIGWKETPYVECPTALNEVADHRSTFIARGMQISLTPGLKADNPLGTSDLMRGEELQLLGWMHRNQSDASEPQLVSLPGTHNKWVLIRNGMVETFLTSPTGELFALIEKHSVLVDESKSGPFNEEAFRLGLHAIHGLGDANLMHALFTTRSHQILKKLREKDAASYLSGLLIGADVAGAVALFRTLCRGIETVAVIGESQLSNCYQIALETEGLSVETDDVARVAQAGYSAIYERWFEEDVA